MDEEQLSLDKSTIEYLKGILNNLDSAIDLMRSGMSDEELAKSLRHTTYDFVSSAQEKLAYLLEIQE